MLKSGSKGDEVRQLQEDLALLGFDPGSADGAFGPNTAAAVKAFQESVDSLDADGIVGPKTASSIELRVGPKRAAQRLAGNADDTAKPKGDAPQQGGSSPM